MKRLQFHPPGATFGASEAPGRGACVSDGFEAGFASRKFLRIFTEQKCHKRLQFRPPESTFGASEAPGRGESIYDGFGADFVSRKFETSRIRKLKSWKLPKTGNPKIRNLQKLRKFDCLGERGQFRFPRCS